MLSKRYIVKQPLKQRRIIVSFHLMRGDGSCPNLFSGFYGVLSVSASCLARAAVERPHDLPRGLSLAPSPLIKGNLGNRLEQTSTSDNVGTEHSTLKPRAA